MQVRDVGGGAGLTMITTCIVCKFVHVQVIYWKIQYKREMNKLTRNIRFLTERIYHNLIFLISCMCPHTHPPKPHPYPIFGYVTFAQHITVSNHITLLYLFCVFLAICCLISCFDQSCVSWMHMDPLLFSSFSHGENI